MRKLNLKRVSAAVALPMVSLLVVGTTFAAVTFGPSRPTFTWANPANYITFNSITDNPVIGDERQFLRTRDLNSPTTAYSTSTQVTNNEDVVMEVYFHNNAASNLNLVAHNTTVKIVLPSGSGTTLTPTAYISASNANPTQVFATADLTSSTPFTLAYEPGTAKLYTQTLNGITIGDSVVNGGTLVGSTGTSGDVPGCSQFAGYVTIRAKVQFVPTTTPTPVTPASTKGLPNTGPGSTLAIFAGASLVAGALHYVRSARRAVRG